jgi:hypothetical protein
VPGGHGERAAAVDERDAEPGLLERHVLGVRALLEVDEVEPLRVPAAVRDRGRAAVGADREPEREVTDLHLLAGGREVPAVRQADAAVVGGAGNVA